MRSGGGALRRFPDPAPAAVRRLPRERNERGSQRGAGAAPAHPAPGPGPRSPGDPRLSPRYSSRGLSRTHRPVRPPDGLSSAAGLGREGAGPASPTPETPRARTRLAAPKTRGRRNRPGPSLQDRGAWSIPLGAPTAGAEKWEPGRGGEGNPAPPRLTEPFVACGDPELTWTAGSLAAAVTGRHEAKPNLPGARSRRRDGGPQTAAVSGVRGGLIGAAWHVLFPLQHRGALRRGGRAPRRRTGRGRPAVPADGASGPPAGARRLPLPAFPRALHRAPRPGRLYRPVPPQPHVSF